MIIHQKVSRMGPDELSEVIRGVLARYPHLTINGIGGAGASFEMDRAALTDVATYYTAYCTCLHFLEVIEPLWETEDHANEILARIAQNNSKKNKIQVGILLLCALYRGCKVSHKKAPLGKEDYFIAPPKVAQGGIR